MFQFLSELDFTTVLLLILALFFVLFYEAINGFHDTANAVATVIYTRAMKDKFAVLMSGFFNFLGVAFGGLSVAYAIVHLLPIDLLLNVSSAHGLAMVFSILLGAIIWNLGTWMFGIPASSSHTLIGAIIGAALVNAFIMDTSIVEALNIPKVIEIFLSLILSPLVGLILAGLMIYVLRRIYKHRSEKKREQIFMNPEERYKSTGKRKPPFWIRTMLIFSAAGVSFSHGANDGQKGIGLLMLVLIGIAPASFIVNMHANQIEIVNTHNAIMNVQEFLDRNQDILQLTENEHVMTQAQLDKNMNDGQYHCNISQVETTLANAKILFENISSFNQLTPDQRKEARIVLMCLSNTVSEIAKNPTLNASEKNFLKDLSKKLLITVEYAPMWIIMAVALALGIGTMIGWRRVAVTIGEKIGKTGMTYAQGVSAQITTAVSIGIASYTGMPVSTTQVLSSSVAGTMIVDGGGVQGKTVRNIALTWILTLPVSILLSGSLYYIAHLIIE